MKARVTWPIMPVNQTHRLFCVTYRGKTGTYLVDPSRRLWRQVRAAIREMVRYA